MKEKTIQKNTVIPSMFKHPLKKHPGFSPKPTIPLSPRPLVNPPQREAWIWSQVGRRQKGDPGLAVEILWDLRIFSVIWAVFLIKKAQKKGGKVKSESENRGKVNRFDFGVVFISI